MSFTVFTAHAPGDPSYAFDNMAAFSCGRLLLLVRELGVGLLRVHYLRLRHQVMISSTLGRFSPFSHSLGVVVSVVVDLYFSKSLLEFLFQLVSSWGI